MFTYKFSDGSSNSVLKSVKSDVELNRHVIGEMIMELEEEYGGIVVWELETTKKRLSYNESKMMNVIENDSVCKSIYSYHLRELHLTESEALKFIYDNFVKSDQNWREKYLKVV